MSRRLRGRGDDGEPAGHTVTRPKRCSGRVVKARAMALFLSNTSCTTMLACMVLQRATHKLWLHKLGRATSHLSLGGRMAPVGGATLAPFAPPPPPYAPAPARLNRTLLSLTTPSRLTRSSAPTFVVLQSTFWTAAVVGGAIAGVPLACLTMLMCRRSRRRRRSTRPTSSRRAPTAAVAPLAPSPPQPHQLNQSQLLQQRSFATPSAS